MQSQSLGGEPIVVHVTVSAEEAIQRGWARHGKIGVTIDPSSLSADDRQALIGAISRYSGGELHLTGDAGRIGGVRPIPSELTADGVLAAARAHAAEARARREAEIEAYLAADTVLLSYSPLLSDPRVLAEDQRRRRELSGRALQALLAADEIWAEASRRVNPSYHAPDEDFRLPHHLRDHLDLDHPLVVERLARDQERAAERLARQREAAARAEAEAEAAKREQEAQRWAEARTILCAEWTETDEQRLAEGRLDRAEVGGRVADRLVHIDRALYVPLRCDDVEHDEDCLHEDCDYRAEDEDESSPWSLTAPQYESLCALRAEAQGIADCWADLLSLTVTVTLRQHTARCQGCGERRRRYGVRVRVATPAGWSASREYALALI
jgi:hypothetical protein